MGKITLHWVGGQMMVGSDTNGHSIVIGKVDKEDSHFNGMKPSDLLLVAAASCSTWDVIEILTKQREPVQDFKVECTGAQMSGPPYSFTNIHIHYIITGSVNPDKLSKAISLSEEKYCSVLSSLRPGVAISSDFTINEGEAVASR